MTHNVPRTTDMQTKASTKADLIFYIRTDDQIGFQNVETGLSEEAVADRIRELDPDFKCLLKWVEWK